MEPRECGECDMCCRWLSHDVYGQQITLDSPCRFIKNGCSIHKNRPAHCKRYECLWSQGVLPEWMFPKDIRIIVSVKNWPHGKWLEIVDPEKKMSDEIFTELQKLEAPIKYYDKLFGPPEFTEFIKDYERKISNLLSPISE
jgi:Fe-S-cluster containining protein